MHQDHNNHPFHNCVDYVDVVACEIMSYILAWHNLQCTIYSINRKYCPIANVGFLWNRKRGPFGELVGCTTYGSPSHKIAIHCAESNASEPWSFMHGKRGIAVTLRTIWSRKWDVCVSFVNFLGRASYLHANTYHCVDTNSSVPSLLYIWQRRYRQNREISSELHTWCFHSYHWSHC